MASKKISELVACTNPKSTDLLVLVANSGSNTEYVTVNNFLTNSSANISSNVVSANVVIISGNTTPANSTANTVKGSIWSDGTYLYVATANNVIKRVTLNSF